MKKGYIRLIKLRKFFASKSQGGGGRPPESPLPHPPCYRPWGGGGNSPLAPPEFLPPPEGFLTVVFYLNKVCKYYHLQTENDLNFLNITLLIIYTRFSNGIRNQHGKIDIQARVLPSQACSSRSAWCPSLPSRSARPAHCVGLTYSKEGRI